SCLARGTGTSTSLGKFHNDRILRHGSSFKIRKLLKRGGSNRILRDINFRISAEQLIAGAVINIEFYLPSASREIKRLSYHVRVNTVILYRNCREKLRAARPACVADQRVKWRINTRRGERRFTSRNRRYFHWVCNSTSAT